MTALDRAPDAVDLGMQPPASGELRLRSQRTLPMSEPRRLQTVGSRGHRRAFWVVAFVFLVVMALGTVPSPLYGLYRERGGFSLLMVTVIYAGSTPSG